MDFLVGAVYRHPHNNVKLFSEQFSKTRKLINQSKTPCFLCSDYNIDILSFKKKSYVAVYLNNLYFNGFCSLINKPTRYSRTSATLLDHLFTNKYEMQLNGVTDILKVEPPTNLLHHWLQCGKNYHETSICQEH